jgi:hypothetical protein
MRETIMVDMKRLVEINQVFTLGAPVQTKDLFSGRKGYLPLPLLVSNNKRLALVGKKLARQSALEHC